MFSTSRALMYIFIKGTHHTPYIWMLKNMCSFTYVFNSSYILKTVLTPLTSVHKVLITNRVSLLFFFAWLIFFGCLLNNFPPIVANYVKCLSPIMLSFGVFYFAWNIIFPNSANTLQLAFHLLTPSQIIQLFLLIQKSIFILKEVNLFTLITSHTWTW